MFPVRCYTCDTVIGQHWTAYASGLKAGRAARCLLDELEQSRMCCRRMFLAHVDLTSEQVQYPAVDVSMDDCGTVLKRRVDIVRKSACD